MGERKVPLPRLYTHKYPIQPVQQLEALSKAFNTELNLHSNLGTFNTEQPQMSLRPLRISL